MGGDAGEAAAVLLGAAPLAFDSWHVGRRLESRRRTVSEADIVGFTQLSGYAAEQLFSDMIYLREHAGHPRRLAPALLTASIADALIVGSGVLEGVAVALVGIDQLSARAPVYAGDTLMVRVEVLSAKPSTSKPDRGVVTTRQEVCNQDGTVVLTYNVSRMLKRAAPGQSRL